MGKIDVLLSCPQVLLVEYVVDIRDIFFHDPSGARVKLPWYVPTVETLLHASVVVMFVILK